MEKFFGNRLKNYDHFNFLLICVLALFPVSFFSFLVYTYKGIFFTELLSFRVLDGWCTLPVEGIGNHCFGDYGFPRAVEYNSKLFNESSLHLANTPLTILIFIALKKLSYNLGLLIYLATMILAIIYPIWNATKGKDLLIKFSSSIFLGLLSIGSIAAIDRGNFIVSILPLSYIFLTSRSKYTQNLSLFFLINLKFWGMIFLIILLSQKRYKEFFLVVGTTITFNIITIQLVFGDIINSLRQILISITSTEYRDIVQEYSISIFGLIRRSNCLMIDNQNCNGAFDEIPFLAFVIFYLVLIINLIISYLYAKKSELAPSIRYAPILICSFLLVPEAPIYQISMVIVIIALLAQDGKRLEPIERKLNWALVFALIFSTVPLAFYWDPTQLLPPQRYFYWLYPIIWIMVLNYFIFIYFIKLRGTLLKEMYSTIKLPKKGFNIR